MERLGHLWTTTIYLTKHGNFDMIFIFINYF